MPPTVITPPGGLDSAPGPGGLFVLWEERDGEVPEVDRVAVGGGEPEEWEEGVTLRAEEVSRGATWAGEAVTVGPDVEGGRGSAGVLRGSGCERTAVGGGNSGGAVSVRWRW